MDPALAFEAAEVARSRIIDEVIERGNSTVQQFYAGAVVFITGGSGFLGKQLVEKLLRSCEIEKIYMLLRPKKNETIDERVTRLSDDPVFEKLRKKKPEFHKKIVPVEGNVSELGLGISLKDRKDITEQVTIIIHGAATISFVEHIRLATMTNVRGTREVLKLGKDCKKLKSFVHISTAFSHATIPRINQDVLEQFYECPMLPETLIDFVERYDDEQLRIMTPHLLKSWPNTYTFTKAVAEEAVRSMSGDLPICIVRPAIVLGAHREPTAGWMDASAAFGPLGVRAKLYAFAFEMQRTYFAEMLTHRALVYGARDTNPESLIKVIASLNVLPSFFTETRRKVIFFIGHALGVLHLLYIRKEIHQSTVPVDLANNAVITAAHETVVRRQQGHTDIKIYNVTSTRNAITFDKLTDIVVKSTHQFPTDKAVYHVSLITTSNKPLLRALTVLTAYIPAYVIDSLSKLFGKQTKLVKLSSTVNNLNEVFLYFTNNEWNIRDTNLLEMFRNLSPEDRVIYNCDTASIDWKLYLTLLLLGSRKYVIKDGLNRTAVGLRKQFWFKWLNLIILTIYGSILYKSFRLFLSTVMYLQKFVKFSIAV